MTDVSGVTGNTATPTPGTSGSTSGSTGSGALGTATVKGETVTITQPDGSKFEYTIPTATLDAKGKAVSNVAPGMNEFAKEQTRKYGQSLDADDFLNLLVAQLRFQDPSKPADTAAMMQQTASMAMLERVNEMSSAAEAMTKASESLAAGNKELVASNKELSQGLGAMLAQQSLSSSIGMIGQSVTYTTGTGDAATSANGVVESVRIGPSGTILTVNGTDVPVDAITAVGKAAASGAAPATAAPATSEPAADGTTTGENAPTTDSAPVP